MRGFGTIVNVFAILAGGVAGLVLRRFLSKRLTDTVMQGVGLAIVIIGISGALSAAFRVADGRLKAEHTLTMILSLAVGALIGELIGIEDKLAAFAKFCENRLVKREGTAGDLNNKGQGAARVSRGKTSETFAQGFVTATLVFCVGSMAIVGAMEDGINANSGILLAKSALDGITAMVFASTLGFGVLFSAAAVGVYQGAITLLAVLIAPWFSETVAGQMSLIGSVLIMSIGLNMLEIAKIKVGNLLPSVFIPAVYYILRQIIA